MADNRNETISNPAPEKEAEQKHRSHQNHDSQKSFTERISINSYYFELPLIIYCFSADLRFNYAFQKNMNPPCEGSHYLSTGTSFNTT